jgi:hypothetical protein
MKLLRLAELRKEIALGAEQADRNEFVECPKAFTKIRRHNARKRQPKE